MGRPSISCGANPQWELHFCRVNNDGTLSGADLSEAVAWQSAVDIDFLSGTQPMIRTLDSGIDHSQAASGIITVDLDANTTTFFEKVNGRNSINAYFEVRGRNSEDKVLYDYRFNINCLGAVDYAGGEPLPVVSGGVTESQVLALLRSAPEYQWSADGTNWHSTQAASDKYYQTRYDGGDWSETIEIQNGRDGYNVQFRYSATGEAESWHSTPLSTDYYISMSNDGGSSWTTSILYHGANGVDGLNGVGFKTVGAYDNATTYHPYTTSGYYEVVAYDGSTYAYINDTASSGHTPPTGALIDSYWQVIAKKGENGSVDNVNANDVIGLTEYISGVVSGEYATTGYVNNAIDELSAAVDYDLLAYATADSVYPKATVDSKLDLKANASNVYSKTDVDTKISTTSGYLQNEIDYLSGQISGGGDLSNYYTKSEVNSISAYLQNEIENIPSGGGSGISGVTFNGAAAPIVNNAAVISALPIATVMPDPAKTDQQFMLYLGSTTSEYSDPLVSYDLIAPSFTFYEAHQSTGSGRVWSGTDALDYNQFKIKWGTSGWILQKYPNDPEHFNNWYDCGEQISARISGEPFGYWKRDIYNEETGSVLSTQYFNVNNLSAIQVKKGHLYEKSGSLNDNVLKVRFGDYGNFYTLYKVQAQSPGTDNIWTDTGNDGTAGSNYYQKLTWSGGPSGHWIWENDEGIWYNSPDTPICNPWDMDGTTWTEPNTSDPMTAVFHIERAFNGGWVDDGSMLN